MYTKHITLTSYTALAHEIYFSLFYAYHIPLFTISTIYFADTEHRRHSFTSPLSHLLFSSEYHFTRHATCSPSCHHAYNIRTIPPSHIQHTHRPFITHTTHSPSYHHTFIIPQLGCHRTLHSAPRLTLRPCCLPTHINHSVLVFKTLIGNSNPLIIASKFNYDLNFIALIASHQVSFYLLSSLLFPSPPPSYSKV